MESASARRGLPRLGADDDAARKRAAVETYARNEAALRRTARRFSLCEDDAEDALQRGLEILLRKAPSADPRELVRWTQTVVKHEALAVRAERERILAKPAPGAAGERDEDWVSLLPASSEGPAEKAERNEAVARSREALQALKPQELRALALLAAGYSYAEIGEITSWSRTKVNRCLAEGRERFRSLVSRSEDGRRCAEMRPLISAFCDREASEEEVALLREHLRNCLGCRATMRAYRAAPAAAAALAPALPLHRSLLERAHEALTHLGSRFGAKRTGLGAQAAGGSGAGGIGAATLVKVAAVCIGGVGGVACVASGLVPVPLVAGTQRAQPVQLEQRAGRRAEPAAAVDYEPAPAPVAEKPEPHADHHPQAVSEPEAPAEQASEGGELPSSAVEYTPTPPPEPAPPPAEVTSGSPAGEFGP